MKVKLWGFDVALHLGGSVAQSLKSTRFFDRERIHDGNIITLGGVVIIVCYVDKAV